ncbi:MULTISPECIES: hypothetical protein [Clostridium]|uniref:hypothetical protein n=1 Tax=Clostridium TaxID=1485 RepID=UPI000825C7E6|nr:MULTISPECIES: hypothetical protein [Clostridium]PJI09023.1 hypothetical protein CUB90_14615 [Clostridium sp. CT7]
MKRKKLLSFFLVLVMSLSSMTFTGCQSFSNNISNIKVKLGLKNNDFQYIEDGKISKIVVQSTRDSGFRFVVTDKNVINDIYDMLSSAKAVNSRSSLKPDYTFQLYKNDKKVYATFNYIAGLDKKDGGNFYNNSKSYVVSNRIDSDIIKNFWEIDGTRSLIDFNSVYYKMISDVVDKYIAYSKSSSIGIEVDNDINAAKFIQSTKLEDFKKKLPSGVTLVESTDDDTSKDSTLNLTTEGYDQTIYKCTATFYNKKTMEQKKYYLTGKYIKSYWNISISETKPNNF